MKKSTKQNTVKIVLFHLETNQLSLAMLTANLSCQNKSQFAYNQMNL